MWSRGTLANEHNYLPHVRLDQDIPLHLCGAAARGPLRGGAGPQPLQLVYSPAGLLSSSAPGLQSFLLASEGPWEASVNEAEAHMRCVLLLELFSVFPLKELGYFRGFLGLPILEAAVAVTSFQVR